MTRPTSAIIDTSALRANFALAQRLAPKAKSMPMVKANAYGLDCIKICKRTPTNEINISLWCGRHVYG